MRSLESSKHFPLHSPPLFPSLLLLCHSLLIPIPFLHSLHSFIKSTQRIDDIGSQVTFPKEWLEGLEEENTFGLPPIFILNAQVHPLPPFPSFLMCLP